MSPLWVCVCVQLVQIVKIRACCAEYKTSAIFHLIPGDTRCSFTSTSGGRPITLTLQTFPVTFPCIDSS